MIKRIREVSIRLLLMVLLTGTILPGQDKPPSFVLDQSKPYAYLRFDHVGDRKAVSPEEIGRGLWLRLVNNSRIPMKIEIFDPGTGDPGVRLYDEIVLESPRMIFGYGKKGQQGTTSEARKSPARPPKGYARPEVISSTTIESGRSLLFSVPLNHVGPSWYMQVKFSLAIQEERTIQQPESILTFSLSDLPEAYQAEASH